MMILKFVYISAVHLYFSVALYIYILHYEALVGSFGFQEVIGKILINFCLRA